MVGKAKQVRITSNARHMASSCKLSYAAVENSLQQLPFFNITIMQLKISTSSALITYPLTA
jgi:hypothetical protein